MNTYFASCPKGSEELIKRELTEIPIEHIYLHKGGVRFECQEDLALEFLLKTRISSRVFLMLDTFFIKNKQDIYSRCVEYDWLNIFNVSQNFKINTLFDFPAKSFFKNSILCSQILKDSIADHFKDKINKRPFVELKNPDISILQRIEAGRKEKDWRCSTYLDLCGSPLSNRGYRKSLHKAPLRENLAAAIVDLTQWNPQEDIFIDLMAGSGTTCFEAILKGANITPSYLKIKKIIEQKSTQFHFQHQNWFLKNKQSQKDFHELINELNESNIKNIKNIEKDQFFANDRSSFSLQCLNENLRSSLFSKDIIHITKKDFSKYKPPLSAPGIVFSNPPYGERLEEKEELFDLYYLLGETFKNQFTDFRAFILTSDSEFRKKISLRTSKRIPIFNGNLECRLLQYDIRNTPKPYAQN